MTYLWAPWRSTYMKAQKEKNSCIFCEAATGNNDEQSLVVQRGEHCFVILNRYPYTSGHLMIAPYDHVSRLVDTSKETTYEMADYARLAEQIVQAAYNPDGLNIGINLGEAAGAGIEQHVHMHVLPQWKGDANFMTSVANTRVLPESLEETYVKLKTGFTTLTAH